MAWSDAETVFSSFGKAPAISLEGRWTIPWGQIEGGESPTAALRREIEEEAGIIARVDGLLGVQELPDPWLGVLGILFLCSYRDGNPTPDGQETDAAQFFNLDQLSEIADTLEPLSEWLARRVLADDVSVIPMNPSGPFEQSPTYL